MTGAITLFVALAITSPPRLEVAGLAKPPVIRLEDGSRGVQVGVKFPVSQHVGVYGMMTHLPSITGHVELGHGYTMPFTLTARPVYNVGVSIDVPVGRKRDR